MAEFNGFSGEYFSYFDRLKKNNSKQWFEKHRAEYDEFVMHPAREYVIAMGKKLRRIAPEVNAIPKINKSLFKINRDVRFSKDKTPYKTHLGIIFWEGKHKKMENPGFYFQLDPSGAEFYSGFYRFSKPFLKAYREAVHDKQLGEGFESILSELNESDGYEWGGGRYKRVPSGYDKDHPRADLLLHKGLWGKAPSISSNIVSSPELVDVCFENALKMMPLHKWLVEVEKIFVS